MCREVSDAEPAVVTTDRCPAGAFRLGSGADGTEHGLGDGELQVDLGTRWIQMLERPASLTTQGWRPRDWPPESRGNRGCGEHHAGDLTDTGVEWNISRRRSVDRKSYVLASQGRNRAW
jgi:hypothetical protein